MAKHKFDSKFEKRVYERLRELAVDVQYEPTTFRYVRRLKGAVCGECGSGKVGKVLRYTPDFRIGTGIFIETKGYFPADRRAAMDDFITDEIIAPKIDLRFVFGSDNKLRKTSETRYSDWAVNHGVLYAIGDVPDEWIEEARQQIANRGDPLQRVQDTAERVYTPEQIRFLGRKRDQVRLQAQRKKRKARSRKG